jgi:hypothetical protein
MNVVRFDLGLRSCRRAALVLGLTIGLPGCTGNETSASSDAALQGAGGFGGGSSAGPGAGGGSPAAAGSGGSSFGAGAGGRAGSTSGDGAAGHPAGAAGSGGPPVVIDEAFGQCRFHYGAIDSVAKASASNIIPQLDMFTPGWMGQSDTFDLGSVCSEGKPGGAFANQVPVIVAYVAAFYVKRHAGVCDCNVTTCGANNDLCHYGAAAINTNLTNIINIYKNYAQGFASCYGTTRPIIFEMEPDFYQYTSSAQTQPWTFAQAGQIMGQLIAAMKPALPNAVFSMDISPWVGTNDNTGGDGSDNGKSWYASFDMTQFTFINTSGGSTDAATAKIRGDAMTWGGVNQVTGKPILADTGYGVNGGSSGPDPAWDDPTNINARIADGVIGITQYNPASTWGTTIAGTRSQLNMPRYCP